MKQFISICGLCVLVLFTTHATAAPKASTSQKPTDFLVKLGTFQKRYPVVVAPNNPKVSTVSLNDVNDNWALAEAVSNNLINQLRSYKMLDQIEALVIPGDNANMLATVLATKLRNTNPDLEFVIIRGDEKSGSFKSVNYQSIRSADKKTLHLRLDQFARLKGKRTLVFDDVLSSGATLKAVTELLQLSKTPVLAYACAATEGQDIEHFNNRKVFKTFYLPTYPNVSDTATKAKTKASSGVSYPPKSFD